MKVYFPLSAVLSYESLSPQFWAFTTSVSINTEPTSYTQAIQQPIWFEAMDQELAALELNRTWTIVDLPPSKRPIECKWIYKLKFKANGSVERVKARLVAKGFTQCKEADYSLFTKCTPTSFISLFVYVDDIILMSSDTNSSNDVKQFLETKFRIKNLGVLRYFLGMEIGRTQAGIQLCQRKYALDILAETGILAAKPSPLPMEPNIKLKWDEGESFHDPALYRKLVGKLLYLANMRPDLSYNVNLLSQFMDTPRVSHYDAVLKILKYIKGTPRQGIFLHANSIMELVAYSDANWANCPDTRRSTIGFCVFIGNSLVSWKSKK
ncbi:hypothetical protein F2P56_028111 [Juglans regia]|uniref:Uncharacterized mitochondrial protein AtMg00810-like n=2 Tax=Juglans regia TaxID=51240 RepID=A0A2I4HWC6_JUGRE|nr:uncharacterized mitochondrial protein AtMg00810-like [Juglans regia]KAF5453191.1 hypothetical protein F2P56_028111 [Juglans regia]